MFSEHVENSFDYLSLRLLLKVRKSLAESPKKNEEFFFQKTVFHQTVRLNVLKAVLTILQKMLTKSEKNWLKSPKKN